MSVAAARVKQDQQSEVDFDYLLEKIEAAPWIDEPFRHLEIRDFLSDEHFDAIVRSPQIKLDQVRSTEELLDSIERHGYRIIQFPGCVTSKEEYLKWFNTGSGRKWHGATEGFGIVYRLVDYREPILEQLDAFMQSEPVRELLVRKFGISRPVEIDAGIQKYLHGYEISPHPDIRRKALTWMLNLNPGVDSESADFHTHYLKFKDRWSFISEFWRGNPQLERDWLPWEWCDTVKRQPKNNSIVFFSPANDTLHAVKASYDHLQTQRTQLYGNLWYEVQRLPKAEYREFDIAGKIAERMPTEHSAVTKLKSSLLGQQVKRLKQALTNRSEKPSVRKVDF